MNKKLLMGMLMFLGCSSEKSDRTFYELSKTGSVAFDLTAATLVYNNAEVQATASSISLKPLYDTLYDFNAGTAQGWTDAVTAIGGSFSAGPDFSGLNLSYTSATNWVGVANLSSSLTDYVMVADFNASTLDGATTLSLCMRMQANLDDHYLYSFASGNVDISSRAAAAFTSLASNALALTPATGTTYMMKASAIGTNLGFRVWDASTAEPGADQVTVVDATYANGSPCLLMQAGQVATYDNVRIGSSTYSTDFVKTDPTVTFPAVSLRAGVRAFEGTVTATGSDDIRFELSLDGGTTYLAWDGSAWSANASGRAGANPLSTFSAQLTNLALPTENLSTTTITVRAYFHSEFGYSTPTLTAPTLIYK